MNESEENEVTGMVHPGEYASSGEFKLIFHCVF
jgi:hypothetical protein